MSEHFHLDLHYPNRSTDSLTFEDKLCLGCKKSVVDEQGGLVVTFGQSFFHVDCFKCRKCRNRVTADRDLLRLSDDFPMCANCSYSCKICHLLILDEAIMTGDDSYHPDCFKCKGCSNRIDQLVFAQTPQGIYCMNCHNERVNKMTRKRSQKKAERERANFNGGSDPSRSRKREARNSYHDQDVLSPSSIPIFPPARPSVALSSTSQNSLSINTLPQLSPGSSTHNGSESIKPAPPAKPTFSSKSMRKEKHSRSSSAPLSVQHGNVNVNKSLGSRSASFSPHNVNSISSYPIPVPFLPHVRRGYWNRRGDHLTPDGHIVYAPEAVVYPAELAAYPLEEEGYQNEDGAFLEYAERPELSASLPWKGRNPEKPYKSFVAYVDDDSRGLLAPHWSSIDPFPRGRTPPKHVTKRPSHKKSPSTSTKQETKDEAHSPSKNPPPVVDPWDLDTRLAVLRSRRPISPTSSSSSYGSAHSTRSRASSFSGSAGGHIPGTTRDVLEFPFGYPIVN